MEINETCLQKFPAEFEVGVEEKRINIVPPHSKETKELSFYLKA